jgi:hypothetical protein
MSSSIGSKSRPVPSDDELLERYWQLADELDALPPEELRERAAATLGALTVLRGWLNANAHEPGRPRKPDSLLRAFVATALRFQAIAVRLEQIGFTLVDDDLLPGEEPGSWQALYALDLGRRR